MLTASRDRVELLRNDSSRKNITTWGTRRNKRDARAIRGRVLGSVPKFIDHEGHQGTRGAMELGLRGEIRTRPVFTIYRHSFDKRWARIEHDEDGIGHDSRSELFTPSVNGGNGETGVPTAGGGYAGLFLGEFPLRWRRVSRRSTDSRGGCPHMSRGNPHTRSDFLTRRGRRSMASWAGRACSRRPGRTGACSARRR